MVLFMASPFCAQVTERRCQDGISCCDLTQEFTLTVPVEPGEYVALCTVICSDDHEGMHMKVVVIP